MRVALLPLLMTACGTTGPDGASSADASSEYLLLEPADRAVRVSMAIRGVRPTGAELEQVHADPAVLPELVDLWLEDPAFGATARDMWAELLQLRNDTFNQLPALGPLQGKRLQQMYEGTVEEPLALVEHIYTNDLPLTELVTSDVVFTNDIGAAMYALPYDPALGGWQQSSWPDARPVAGLLSSAQVFRRWESDGSNFNRARANMLADVLLCESFAERDIVVEGGIDIADEFQVAEAVRTNPSCVSCHQALDPLAAYFWGYKKLIHRNFVADSINADCEFDWSNGNTPEFGIPYIPEDFCYPLVQYGVADEDAWLDWDLREPSYYGTPARDLGEVGQLVADDPRFASCMAAQTFGYLAQVDRDDVPFDVVQDLTDRLVSSAFSPKDLVRAVVLSDAFAAHGTADASDPRSLASVKVARPEQYARTVERLTGFRWFAAPDLQNCDDPANADVQRYGTQCWGDLDLSDSDVFGFRAMAGGIDGKVVTRPTRTFTPTRTLVIAQLAANAAGYVVERDLALPAGDRRLLGQMASPRDQLVQWHADILGEVVAADGSEVAADLALLGEGSPHEWKLVLTALLQDPRLLMF